MGGNALTSIPALPSLGRASAFDAAAAERATLAPKTMSLSPPNAPSSHLPLQGALFSAGSQLTIVHPGRPRSKLAFSPSLPPSLAPSPLPQASDSLQRALQAIPPLGSTAVPSLLAWQYRLHRHRRAASALLPLGLSSTARLDPRGTSPWRWRLLWRPSCEGASSV